MMSEAKRANAGDVDPLPNDHSAGSTGSNSHRSFAIEVFRLHAEARLTLFAAGEFDLHFAVDELQRAAAETRLLATIGQDAVQAIMAEAFGAVT